MVNCLTGNVLRRMGLSLIRSRFESRGNSLKMPDFAVDTRMSTPPLRVG